MSIKLESVELKGFKSFAKRTKIKFDNQITAIVGPNGSGKSNIADAVKWVLGEQSAKSLRGRNMNDVIFQGSDDKNPMNMAEVNLSFENKDRKLDSNYDLIKVSRRIYRNGDNEYRLNGKRVRLKDIKELFLDTGIGKEGYSVIGQGRIDEILNSSSQERRNIFEEASGIATHKYRREESLKKLSKVDEDLEVIQREWEYKKKDNERLEDEAKNFDKHKEIVDKLDSLSLIYLKSKSKGLNDKKKSLYKKLDEINLKKEEKTAYFNKVKKALEPIAKELNELEELNDSMENESQNLEKKIVDFNNQIKLDFQKLDYNQKDLDRNTKDKENYKNKLEDTQNTLEIENKKLEKTKQDIKNMLSLKSKKDKEKSNIIIDLDGNKKNLKNISKEISILEKNVYDYDLNQKTKSILKKQREEENQRIKERLKNLEKDIEKISSYSEILRNKYQDLNDKKEESENKLSDISKKINENSNEIERFKNLINQNNISSKEEISNYKIQKSLLEKHEGYFYSVSDFLNKSKGTKIEDLYIDTLANLITVKEGYENIIENLIGQGLQNIVTRTKIETREIINFVNKNKLGRLTFLPIDSIKQSRKPKINEDEVIAMAYELVRYDPKLEHIVNHFLYNTVVVKNIDDAISLSNKIKGYRIISLNLDLINTWGSMVAGVNKSRRSNTAILNRNKKISDIRNRILKLREDKKDLSKKITIEENKFNDKIKEKNKISQYLDELKMSMDKLNREIDKSNYELESNRKRINELNESLKLEDLKEDDSNIDVYKKNLENLKKNRESLEKVIENLTTTLNDLSNNIFKLENNIEINKRDLNIYVNNIRDKESEIQNLQDSISYSNKFEQSIKKDIKKLEDTVEKIRLKIDYSNKRKIELKDKVKAIQNNIEDKKLKNSKLIIEAKEIEKLLNDLSMQSVKINYSLESISKDYKNLEDEIRPFISESIELLKDKKIFDNKISVKKEDLFKLQKDLSKVGFFDENSKESYKISKDEFDFLDKQKTDLEESKKDIEEMIKKLEVEMKKEFIKNFNIIDDKFQRIFKELFMGGKAKLSLDSDDFLNAGIEISACPPNKTTKSLSLLSGGEKSLTAVALLFAIFETNPAPFSLLDEIDAAMDESNIKRYINYLKSLSDKTQFIMITHRQTTMQLADKIHGVTIEDNGISKIYSIDFDN
ncbi:chromosome segregation protein SMC [Anaerococcus porci]|uniref:chromosome segregation protein SMC n=1 Tax=Anaerococcus porci TaxID=2652269 RepID=UPI002A75AEDA|nr:chromosome segregation protein SMC [Anaerococcus porci]MDY3006186.1 chromosome segregation protein SMC [Anaerococcus porci]